MWQCINSPEASEFHWHIIQPNGLQENIRSLCHPLMSMSCCCSRMLYVDSLCNLQWTVMDFSVMGGFIQTLIILVWNTQILSFFCSNADLSIHRTSYCRSICLHASVCLSIYLLSVCLSVYHLSVCLYVYLSVCLSLYLLSVCLYVCLSGWLAIYLSIVLSFYHCTFCLVVVKVCAHLLCSCSSRNLLKSPCSENQVFDVVYLSMWCF